jgi:hypothetical protein
MSKYAGFSSVKVQPYKKTRLHLTVGYILFLLTMLSCNIVLAGVDYTGIGYRTTTVYSEGAKNRWWMGESMTKVRFTTGNFGLTTSLELTHSRPEGDLRWGYDKGALSLSDIGNAENGVLSGRVFFREQSTQSVLTIAAFKEKIATSLGWRYISENRQEYFAGINLKPLQNFSVGFKRGNMYPIPPYSELFYSYLENDQIQREGGQLNWEAPAWMNEFTADLSLMESIYIESSIREFDFRPRSPEPGESPLGTYLGVIDGLWFDSRVSVEYKTNPVWSVDFMYRQSGIRNHLQMFDGGQQFANFSVIEADISLWSVGFDYKNWRLNFQNGHGEGELGGVVKAWPFVDGLYQFLGERRQFVGIAEADWRLTTLTGELIDSRRLHLKAILDYLYIKPDMSYAHWSPKPPFGIGIEDLKSGQLDITRADLIRLSLMPVIKLGHFGIEFNISQWLPLSVDKLDKNQEVSTSTPGPDTNSGASKEKSTTWGGFDASVNLIVEF